MNMLTVQYALEYAKEGFTIFGISPGVSLRPLGVALDRAQRQFRE